MKRFCIYMKFDEELMLHYFNKTLDKGILTGNTELLLDAINEYLIILKEKVLRIRI